MTFLHRGLHRHRERHGPAALSGHGNTVGLRDLSDDSVTHSHGLRVTHSLGNIFLHNLAVLSGDGGTLGDGDTLGNCDAVGGDHLLVDGGADRDGDTVRHRDALRDGHTDGDLDTLGHSHGPAGLHWDAPALPLHLLLALLLPGSHGHHSRGNGGNNGGGHGHSCRTSPASQAVEEQLRISLSISLSISLGVSLALHDLGGSDESGVEAKSADKRTNSGGGSKWSHWSQRSNWSHWSHRSHNTSGLYDRNCGGDDTGVVDHSLVQLDLGVDLLADVGHDVLALNITYISIIDIDITGVRLIPPL